MNHWNGGGTAIADLDNDGLPEIILTSNLNGVSIYRNKGQLKFEKVQLKESAAQLPSSWYSGMTVADYDHDGLKDIFLCRKALPDSRNILLRNLGNLRFTDVSESVGLLSNTNTTNASFIDFDNDGDLDLYVLNNDNLGTSTGALYSRSKNEISKDRLWANVNGQFVDVTDSVLPTSKPGGLGLGLCTGDIDWDGTEEIYVANDLFSKDHLYKMESTGVFQDIIESSLSHLSLNSMGCAITDIDNDLWPDILVLDMLSDNELERKKRDTHNSNKLNRIQKSGGYLQIPQNTLHLNQGGTTFSEVAHWSNVAATDWSWSPLVLDLNNDGYKDIFVSNSLKQDILDLDFLKFTADSVISYNPRLSHSGRILKEMAMKLKPLKLQNRVLQGSDSTYFANHIECEFLNFNTNGAAYGDLDRDGDLDIVCNNLEDTALVIENLESEIGKHNYIQFQFGKGFTESDMSASKFLLYYNGGHQFQTLPKSNGFQSCSEPLIHFGLGNIENIDSVLIILPRNEILVLNKIKTNQRITINNSIRKTQRVMVSSLTDYLKLKPKYQVEDLTTDLGFKHAVNGRLDFGSKMNRLNIKGSEFNPPSITVSDFDGNGLSDVYISDDQGLGNIYYQYSDSSTIRFSAKSWIVSNINEYSKRFSVHDSKTFDIDGDMDKDLLLVGAPYPWRDKSAKYSPITMLNDGSGQFTMTSDLLPQNDKMINQIAIAADSSQQQVSIILLGGLKLENYPKHNSSWIVSKTDSTYSSSKLDWMNNLGASGTTTLSDLNNDGIEDLVMGVENGPVITVLGPIKPDSKPTVIGAKNARGWWQGIECSDLDGDGDKDIILGNTGRNMLPQISQENPLIIFTGDLDKNGKADPLIIHKDRKGRKHFLQSRDDLVKQVPSLNRVYQSYNSYADSDVSDLLPDSILRLHSDTVNELRNMVLINNGNNDFSVLYLPRKTEFGTCNQIFTQDMNGDGVMDILLFGNDHVLNSNYGLPDGNPGWVVEGKMDVESNWLPADLYSLSLKGNINSVATLKLADGTHTFVLGRSNGPVSIVKIEPIK
jgi:hypothetical protein